MLVSKVEDMRTLKAEIRAAGTQSRADRVPQPAPVLDDVASARAVARRKPVTTPSTGVDSSVCGHRGMGNRPCVRPADHPEKSHRYGPKPPPAAT